MWKSSSPGQTESLERVSFLPSGFKILLEQISHHFYSIPVSLLGLPNPLKASGTGEVSHLWGQQLWDLHTVTHV